MLDGSWLSMARSDDGSFISSASSSYEYRDRCSDAGFGKLLIATVNNWPFGDQSQWRFYAQ